MRHLILYLTLLFVFFPTLVFAHNAQQLPFLKINDAEAVIYPVGSTSLTTLVLPQDLAPGTYLVNTPVQFALETVNLPILPEYIPQTVFQWDLGDGTSGTGLSQTHTYTKIGSYVITIKETPQDGSTAAQLLDIVQINIVPNASYQLPKSVILVNSRQSTNPYTDILKNNIHQDIYLDGSKSSAPSSTIASYTWDFGDGQSGSTATAIHVYDAKLEYVLPLLRITDANGFFADSLVQIENDPTAPVPTPPVTAPTLPTHSGNYLVIIVLVLAVACGVIAYRSARRTTR